MRQLSFLMVITLALTACKKEALTDHQVIPNTSGMLVGCEGSFGMINASLHMIYDDGTARNDIYLNANGAMPGDVLQSVRVFEENTYLVMNASQKVNVVGTSDMVHKATISGCDYPRDVYQYSENKGYISNGSLDGELLIFNPLTADVVGSIAVGMGPEEIAFNGSYLFVANSGGWDYDQTVSVIDPVSDQVVTTVEVSDRPVALEVDSQNNVWVLCKGDIIYDANWNVIDETEAKLIKIDGMSHEVIWDVTVGEWGDHPEFMAIDGTGNMIYIENNDILRFNAMLGEFEQTFAAGNFFGVGVHPVSGDVFTALGVDYISPNNLHIFTSQGSLDHIYEVGIAPRSYAYRD